MQAVARKVSSSNVPTASMPLPQSTLDSGLVPPTRKDLIVKTGPGKYKSTLTADLMGPDDKPKVALKEGDPGASKLGPGLVEAKKPPPPPAEPAEPPPRKPPVKIVGDLPAEPEYKPVEYYEEPRRCFFTGDDLPPFQRVKQPPGRKPIWPHRESKWGKDILIYNQEDMPKPEPKHPALQRLHEWRSKVVMEERLDMHDGFSAIEGASKADREVVKNEWFEGEAKFRGWEDGQSKLSAEARAVAVLQEQKNDKRTQYGEKMPPRGKGELLPPWAPRGF